jgi:hypothetical protein
LIRVIIGSQFVWSLAVNAVFVAASILARSPLLDGSLSASVSAGGMPAMSKDTEITPKEHPSSLMEDFGRFSPVETPDSDTEITDESFDEAYEEENTGA